MGTKVVRPAWFTACASNTGTHMANSWYFTRNDERQGPISSDRLKAMAREGWLRPEDLVWRPGMPNWAPAKKVQGLFRPSALQLVGQALLARRAIPESIDDGADEDARPPALPEKPSRRRTRRGAKPKRMVSMWERLSPRHLLTAAGGFLSALGIAFTVIAQTRLALALALGGLFVLLVGLAPEIGRLVSEALDNIGMAMQDTARRRLTAQQLDLRNQELDLQKQWIDLESARLAHQDKALDRLLPFLRVLGALSGNPWSEGKTTVARE